MNWSAKVEPIGILLQDTFGIPLQNIHYGIERYTTRNCKIPCGYIVILKRVLSRQSTNADLQGIVPHNTNEGFPEYLFGFINTVLRKFPNKLTFSKSCFWCICTAIGWQKIIENHCLGTNLKELFVNILTDSRKYNNTF